MDVMLLVVVAFLIVMVLSVVDLLRLAALMEQVRRDE